MSLRGGRRPTKQSQEKITPPKGEPAGRRISFQDVDQLSSPELSGPKIETHTRLKEFVFPVGNVGFFSMLQPAQASFCVYNSIQRQFHLNKEIQP
jgi:hypothetical protein